MLKKLLHIGIVVENLDKAIKRFEAFGLHCKEVIEIERVGVKVAFFPIGDTSIELLWYLNPEGESDAIVRSQGRGLNHLCFEVEDLSAAITNFEKNAAKLVECFPRKGTQGQIVFFYPETTEGVLIEICQP